MATFFRLLLAVGGLQACVVLPGIPGPGTTQAVLAGLASGRIRRVTRMVRTVGSPRYSLSRHPADLDLRSFALLVSDVPTHTTIEVISVRSGTPRMIALMTSCTRSSSSLGGRPMFTGQTHVAVSPRAAIPHATRVFGHSCGLDLGCRRRLGCRLGRTDADRRRGA
jgi:hypothetical protein